MIKHHIWSAITFMMGEEIDDLFYKKAIEQKRLEDEEITITKKDLNKLYFDIKTRVESNIVIEENLDVKTIRVKRGDNNEN